METSYLSLDPYVARYYNSTEGELYGDKEHYNYNTSVSFNVASYPVARFVNEVRTLISLWETRTATKSMQLSWCFYIVWVSFHAFHLHLGSCAQVSARLRLQFHRHPSPQQSKPSSSPFFHSRSPRMASPRCQVLMCVCLSWGKLHQHNPAGNLSYPWPADDGQMQMSTGVSNYFPVPNISSDSRTQLAQWAYSTQGARLIYGSDAYTFFLGGYLITTLASVFQAAFMASEIHYYRLGASRGENNMGESISSHRHNCSCSDRWRVDGYESSR